MKKLNKPSRASYRNVTSPEIFLLALILIIFFFRIVTNPIASVDNMKRMQCIVLN